LISVGENGKAYAKGTQTIVGSSSTLLETFHHLITDLNIPLERAVAMLSSTPATIAGLSHIGSLQIGKRADFLVLDEALSLKQTFINGTVVWSCDQ
jgi:N-acetylglucosamine-6-phosphate deacetylase